MSQPPPAVEFADCRIMAGSQDRPDLVPLDLLANLKAEELAEIVDVLEGPYFPEGEDDWRRLPVQAIERYTPITADWKTPAAELSPHARLLRLARVKPLLPPNNLEKRKTRHNKSIEGYMQLALEAAGDRETLHAHMQLIAHRLAWSEQPNRLLALHTLWVWGPLAEVMGWHEEKHVLEDLAFARYMPKQYQAVKAAYERYGGNKAMREYMLSTQEGLEAVINGELAEEEQGSVVVEVRQKSYYSVWRKCEKDKRPSYDLPDFIGARVIVDDVQLGKEEARLLCHRIKNWVEECYQAASRFKDYIHKPKPNGYQSLHLSLEDLDGQRLELQVRTATMHARAETDPGASHIAYEATHKLTPQKYFKKLNNPHRIYLWREDAAKQLRQRLQDADASTAGLRPSTIIVFRDNGNLHTLNEGYNVLDMAFDVHWQHALTTTGATVNGEVGAFDRVLENYDVVSLKRTPNGRLTWTLDWIHTVKSKNARKHLERALRDLEEPELVARAEKELTAYFERMGVRSAMSLFDPITRKTMHEALGFETWGVLMRSHALGFKGAGEAFFEAQLRKAHPELFPTVEATEAKEAKSSLPVTTGQRLYINGERWREQYHIGRCCESAKSQDVVVFASQSRGMFVVHSRDCVNVADKKVLDASWEA